MALVQIPDEDSVARTTQWRIEHIPRQGHCLHMLARDRHNQEPALIDLICQRVRIEDFSGKMIVEVSPKGIDIGRRVDRPFVRKALKGLAAAYQAEIDNHQVGRYAPPPCGEERPMLVCPLGLQRSQIDIPDLSPAMIGWR